ncbi:MAG: SGNH/GDSL hydrolase family protein [Armatimonadetes bacterium]|nr:SGNH/GDSL hydrolase family protein [Armatimonadota bacterium]
MGISSAAFSVHSPWTPATCVLARRPADPPPEAPKEPEDIPDHEWKSEPEPVARWRAATLLAIGVASTLSGLGPILHPPPPPVVTVPQLRPTIQETEARPWITIIGMGDSLTSGMQDGTLEGEHQHHSYLAQFSRQAGIRMRLPEIVEDGIPPRVLGPVFELSRYAEVHTQLREDLKRTAISTEYLKPPRRIPSPLWGMGSRAAATRESEIDNLAVPGFEFRHLTNARGVHDLLVEVHEGTDDISGLANDIPLAREIIQHGTDTPHGSQLEQTIRRNPDVVVLWAGSNDALAPAFSGVVDDQTLTPILDKQWDFWHQDLATGGWSRRQSRRVMPGMHSAILGRKSALERLKRETRAEIFVFTVPQVDNIPFLRTAGEPVGRLPFRVRLHDGSDVTERIERFVIPRHLKGEGIDGRTEVPAGSRVGLGQILDLVAKAGEDTDAAGFAQRLDQLEQAGFLTEFDVLDPQEMETVRERIEEYNTLLRQAARDPRVHLIDVNPVFAEARAHGRPLRTADGREVRVTTGFSGVLDERGYDGIFSLDGIHPSDTGHAILANLLLERMKADLGGHERFRPLLEVPPIDEASVHDHETHGTELH